MKISVIEEGGKMHLKASGYNDQVFIVSPSSVSNSFLLYMLGNTVVGDMNAMAVTDGGLFKESVTLRHRTHPGEPILVSVRFSGNIIHNLASSDAMHTHPFLRETLIPVGSPVGASAIRGYPDPELRVDKPIGKKPVSPNQEYMDTTHTALTLEDMFDEIADRIALVQTALKMAVFPDTPTPDEGNLIPLGRIDIPVMVEGTGNSPMLARFRCVNTYGPYPLTVKFIDESIGHAIDCWVMDFDDGTSLERNAKMDKEFTHTYDMPGEFRPSLYIAGRTKGGFEAEGNYLFPACIDVGEVELDGDDQY